MRLDIKPMSVNEAWQGKRYRTKQYDAYIEHVCLLLKPMDIPEGPLFFRMVAGQSSNGCDFDNPIKPFVDCLQKYYGFNDNRIMRSQIDKVIVPKGEEYIEFSIEALE